MDILFEHKDTKTQSRYRRRQNIAQQISLSKYRRRQISPQATITKYISPQAKYREVYIA
jgi:hypothetical protein